MGTAALTAMTTIAADKKYKVVMLGDSTVGKSSILYRLKFSSFSGKQESTIGCEFFAKPIPIPERPDQPVKLLIWDTAGQEVFRSFTPNLLRPHKPRELRARSWLARRPEEGTWGRGYC